MMAVWNAVQKPALPLHRRDDRSAGLENVASGTTAAQPTVLQLLHPQHHALYNRTE